MNPTWPEHFAAEVVRPGFGGRLSSYTIALEAWRRGLTVTFNDPILRKYTISDDVGRTVRFLRARPHMTTRSAVRVANDKYQTHELLRHAGVPTPEAKMFDSKSTSWRDLANAAEEIGYPVVLKPLAGSMGRGVFANITSPNNLKERFDYLTRELKEAKIVLEEHVAGDDFRVLVVGGQVAGACQRVPANIVGDGRRSVDELISTKNTARQENPFLSKGLILKDYETEVHLANHGLDYTSVPGNGDYIQLRSAANASAGGDVVDVTDTLPERITSAAVSAIQAVPELFCAGVDVLYDTASGRDNPSFTILELNAHPQIGVNMYPSHGVGSDAPKVVVDQCFPNSYRDADSDLRDVSFELSGLLFPLTCGAAQSITLAPIPAHRWAYRRAVTMSPAANLEPDSRRRLLRAAHRRGLAGRLRPASDETHLLVAGEQQGVQEFIRLSQRILKTELVGETAWTGPVMAGFFID